MKKILVTGGCGYKGSVLVPKLLGAGYEVTVIDTQWFGNFLSPHKHLTVLQTDLREINRIDLNGVDSIVHLASVANDPCGDLDPALTWEISALATQQLVDKAVRYGVKNFLFASSGAVYGVRDEQEITEDLALMPITAYSQTKVIAERILLSYKDRINIQIVRPATVCGYSPRTRLDVSVNLLTMAAIDKGVITVFGGSQTRPNIHIDDITDLYLFLLRHADSISGVYNAGFENLTIRAIAEMVADRVNVPIEYTASSDPRSYRLNSDKLLATGFKPSKNIEDAVADLIEKYRAGLLKNTDRHHNLKWMQRWYQGRDSLQAQAC